MSSSLHKDRSPQESAFFAVFSNVDLLRYIVQFHYKTTLDAIRNNRSQILRNNWALLRKSSDPANEFRAAALLGSIEIIEFLREKFANFDTQFNIMIFAAI
jgi:hypothetical protein